MIRLHSAIIDFDHAQRAPAMVELATLLSFIALPQQFAEGRPEFATYKGKNFLYLLPVLQTSLPRLFEDPDLLKKLNLIYIAASISLVAENWSAKANEALIHDLIHHELPLNDDGLRQTFYGRTLYAPRDDAY